MDVPLSGAGSLRDQRETAAAGKRLAVEFVTFHVALGSDRAIHPNKTLQHREYLSMIDMMFGSARLFHPGAKTAVITDLETRFDRRTVARHVIARFAMDPQRLMLERAEAQLRYIQESRFESPIVLLDSDILINGSLSPLFEEDFDVAVTWRASKRMPINGGFLILNNRRPEVSRSFFERYVRTYREQYAQQAAWYGDQFALRDCVGLNLKQYAAYRLREVNGCRMLLLPCDTYNFSPDNDLGEIGGRREDKVVFHFKGERKRLMAPFWRAWLHPRGSANPFVQYRGWRERRRLYRFDGEAPASRMLQDEEEDA